MSAMDDRGADEAAFHDDMLQLERRIDELLDAAATRPLTETEVLDLRLFAGVPAARPAGKAPAPVAEIERAF